ncbi:hypothetical protein MKW92_041751 [Papaver armeniacum]|nr:hypothetical protein MKW92_041751 [Papaver armeniacum]
MASSVFPPGTLIQSSKFQNKSTLKFKDSNHKLRKLNFAIKCEASAESSSGNSKQLQQPLVSTTTTPELVVEDETLLWSQIKAEALRDADSEPASLSFHLGNKPCSSTLLSTLLYDLFLNSFATETAADLKAVRACDPACVSYYSHMSIVKHIELHKLWVDSRRPLALALHSRIADVFTVDIHPAAKIGKGILFDHASGVVVGETVVIGNNIGDGVLIGAGATILGNIKIGEGAKTGAGSVVLIDVSARTTAVGNPARLVGGKEKPSRHEDVPGESMTIPPSYLNGPITFYERCLKTNKFVVTPSSVSFYASILLVVVEKMKKMAISILH